MVNFINPGVLGAPEAFKSLFQTPITRGRDKNADDEVRVCACTDDGSYVDLARACEQDRALGRARSIELSKITKNFILRRTSKVNEKYLPAKVGERH
jgi:SNF2 family DNA or RNA helicase